MSHPMAPVSPSGYIIPMKITSPIHFRLPKLKLVWEEEPSLGDGDGSTRTELDAPPSKGADHSGTAPEGVRKALKGSGAVRSEPRPFWVRLLSLRVGQAMNLLLWCVLAGVIMQLTGFNLLHTHLTAGETAGNLWQQGFAALGWMIGMGWKPALLGATLVIPIWLVWRLLTFPFRR